MKDFYPNTRKCIDKYNQISDEIFNGEKETSDEQEEFIMNFCVHLAHALIKDTGGGQLARDELIKMADIIDIVCG